MITLLCSLCFLCTTTLRFWIIGFVFATGWSAEQNDLRFDGSDELRVGVPWSGTITAENPKAMVELSAAPDGLSLSNGKLQWTPTLRQAGEHRITFRVWDDTNDKEVSIQLKVGIPFLSTGWRINGISLSASRKELLAWNSEPPIPDPHARGPKTEVQSHFAAFDLKDSRPKWTASVSTLASHALLTDKYLVLIRREEQHLLVLFVDRSSLATVKSITATGIVLTEKYFLVIDGNRLHALSCENLALQKIAEQQDFLVSKVRKSRHGLYIDGVLYDEALKTQLIVGNLSNTTLIVNNFMPRGESEVLVHEQGNLAQGDGIPIDEIRGDLADVTDILVERVDPDRLSVVLAWKLSGETLTISRIPNSMSNESRNEPKLSKLSIANRLYFADKSKIYVLDTSDFEIHRMLSSRFMLRRKQSRFTLSSDKQTVLTHEFVYPVLEDVTYTLVNAIDGMQIDSKTGQVTIDNEKAIGIAADYVIQFFLSNSQLGVSFAKILDHMIAEPKHWFTRAIARAPRGVPVLFPVQIKASSGNLNHDEMWYFVIVEVPTSLIEERLEQLGNPIRPLRRVMQLEKQIGPEAP